MSDTKERILKIGRWLDKKPCHTCAEYARDSWSYDGQATIHTSCRDKCQRYQDWKESCL